MRLEDFFLNNKVDFKRAGEHHHATPGRLQVDCPFCSPGSQRYRMGVSHRGASCWTCGSHRLVHTLSLITRLPWEECKAVVGSLESMPKGTSLPMGRLNLPAGIGTLKMVHRRYLRRRGYNISELKRLWKIEGIAHLGEPHLTWRIFIPIIADGRVVSWTTRSIDDKIKSKYVNARPDQEVYPAKECLYGEDYTKHSAVIVEGPTGVWRIGPGAVATMGVEYSTAQVLGMSRFTKRWVCFDPEPDAQRRARKLCEDLSVFGPTFNICLETGDPGNCSEKELNQLRRLLE